MRFWAWLLVVSLDYLLWKFHLGTLASAYDSFSEVLARMIPASLILSFHYIVVLSEISALGAVAAYLMPPIKKASTEAS